MKLELVKMGMDNNFNDGINNYRIRTKGECINGKDGRKYFLEFTVCNHSHYRKTNKRTGKPLKKWIWEVIKPHAIHLDTEYTTEENMSYRNAKLEEEVYNKHLDYNIANILDIVNEISKDKYTDIVFVDR